MTEYLSEAPDPAFEKHMVKITDIVLQIPDQQLQVEVVTAIEELIDGMNGPWRGQRCWWRWGEVPDNLADLFSEEGD